MQQNTRPRPYALLICLIITLEEKGFVVQEKTQLLVNSKNAYRHVQGEVSELRIDLGELFTHLDQLQSKLKDSDAKNASKDVIKKETKY